jgi:hypothetical protein
VRYKADIKGTLCEIAENKYSLKYGYDIIKSEILHTKAGDNVTILGDLTKINTLPNSTINCFIATQTLQFIYDYKSAIIGIYHMLTEGGVALATVPSITHISRYDMDNWGEYWRFTPLSIKIAFEEVFSIGNVDVDYYGNILAATSFLHGIGAQELSNKELFHKDPDYPVTIVIRAIKRHIK